MIREVDVSSAAAFIRVIDNVRGDRRLHEKFFHPIESCYTRRRRESVNIDAPI